MRNAAKLLFKNFGRRRHFSSSSSSSAVLQDPTVSPAMDPSRRYCFSPKLKWNPQVEEYFVDAYGKQNFGRISKAMTCPSCYSCIRVNTLKSSVDVVLEKLRALAKESIDGKRGDSLRSRRTGADIDSDLASGDTVMELDNVAEADVGSSKGPLGPFGSAPDSEDQGGSVSKCQIPGLKYVIFVQGSGPHQIDYGYASNSPPKEVVSRKCTEAVLRGAQVFVLGVMGSSAHVEKGDAVAVSVAVEQHNPTSGWGLHMTRGIVLQGRQTERNGLYSGQGIAMMSRAGIFRDSGVAIDMTNRVYRLPSFNELLDVLEGEIFLQNLPSIVTTHALGERILDICGAPGGKTTAIAHLMKDEGVVVPLSFDRVLRDSPCSALGLRPRLFSGEETIESLRNYAKYQQRMFDQAVQLVRPGGVINVSVQLIPARMKHWFDIPFSGPSVGGPGLVGSYTYSDWHKEKWLNPGEEYLVQRLDLSSPLDTIGYFIVKFVVDKSQDSKKSDLKSSVHQ